MALYTLTLFLSFIFISQSFEPVKKACDECVCVNKNDDFLLNCTNAGLNNIFNEWPPHTNKLIVSFSYNNFTELQQMPYSNASITISFNHCNIKYLTSAMFIDATGIQNLDFSWNFLTGQEIHADVFRGRYSQNSFSPISLLNLDLSHNRIESILSTTFEHTPKLKKLNLSYNPLRKIDPQTSHAISSLMQLEILNLANTSLEVVPMEMFSRLRKLKDVDLSQNFMKRVPEGLEYLSGSLLRLNLGANLIEHLEDHEFIGLHLLKELNISANINLKTIRHNTFAYTHNLKVLYCENNKNLIHIHETAFGTKEHIPNLEDLYLSFNKLSTLSVNLLNWKTLKTLSLEGNNWICDCTLFQTLSKISNESTNLLTPEATCSLPLQASGVSLQELDSMEKLCKESIRIISRNQGPGDKIMKAFFVISLILLLMVVGFVFFKVLTRYNNIRSINTMFPVMYISAPTTEN